MIVKMTLCGLNLSGSEFQAKLAGAIHEMGYTPTKADPDVWNNTAVKPDGS